jgi:predicted RNA binding protein YcfA (HicA-like mRNA interferase family)
LTKLRLVPYRELKKVAEAAGFKWLRCEGSHNIFRHASGKIVVIPDHGSQVIVRPLLRKILRDLGINPKDYNRLIEAQ